MTLYLCSVETMCVFALFITFPIYRARQKVKPRNFASFFYQKLHIVITQNFCTLIASCAKFCFNIHTTDETMLL